jgi:hypothetical protein
MRGWAWMMCVGVAVSAIGCSSTPQLGVVTGKVTLNGKPVTAGVVTMVAKSGGEPVTANINEDGSYRVEVVLPENYADPGSSGFVVKVKPLSEGEVQFDLALQK